MKSIERNGRVCSSVKENWWTKCAEISSRLFLLIYNVSWSMDKEKNGERLFFPSCLMPLRKRKRRRKRRGEEVEGERERRRRRKSIFSHELILKQSFVLSVCVRVCVNVHLQLISKSMLTMVLTFLLLFLLSISITYGQNQITGKKRTSILMNSI